MPAETTRRAAPKPRGLFAGGTPRGARLRPTHPTKGELFRKREPADDLTACAQWVSMGKRGGARMSPDAFALMATVILLLPMGYFFLAAPAFLLVRLDIPQVAQLLRGMFNVYFVMLLIAGVIGTLAFAVAGRPAFVFEIGLIAAFALLGRRWFLQRMDAQIGSRPAAGSDAARRLRRLHWGGMLCNAVQLAAFIGSIPYIHVSI
jgi:hypothetical protein